MHFYRNFLVFRTFKKPTETKHRKKAGGDQTSGGELSKNSGARCHGYCGFIRVKSG